MRTRIHVTFALSLAVLATYGATLQGVPATPVVHSLVQADGTRFEARQWGDEWLHGWETLDSYTIVFDRVSRNWVYARQDLFERLVGTDRVVRQHRPPPGVAQQIRSGGEALQTAHARRREAYVKVVPSTGSANIPVILINFNDTSVTYAPDDFQFLLFETDPMIASGPGSMKDYYEEISYGAFTVTSGPSGISGWVEADQGHDNYGDPNKRAAILIREAVEKADATFDFSSYDNDGDGRVDVVAIVHQGRGQEGSGNPSDIWSHRWSLSAAAAFGFGDGAYRTDDGVTVDDYIIMPERFGTDNISTIGVFAHEFGHSLGLPDLYDTDLSSAGIGRWGLMGTGCWNRVANPGDSPAHMTVWSKWYLGWLTPTQINSVSKDTSIPQVETNAVVYQLLDNPGGVDWVFTESSGSGEYFLVENRQRVGFDVGLPGTGLLIWHIDESVTSSNSANANENGRRLVALVQADGLQELERGLDRGDVGDPFPGIFANRAFDDSTEPSSRLHDGGASEVSVADISDSGAVMAADLAILPTTDVGPLISVSVFPNPAMTEARFQYVLPDGVESATLLIYNVAGRPVRRLTLDRSDSEFTWDLHDQNGTPVASGLYLCVVIDNSGKLLTPEILRLIIRR